MMKHAVMKLIGIILFCIPALTAEAVSDPQDLLDAMMVETYQTGHCLGGECACGQEAYEAEYQLTAMGEQAFVTLLENMHNPSRSCRVSRLSGQYDDSIGAFCQALLIRFLEGPSLTATLETIDLNGIDENHRIFAALPKEMLVSWVRKRLGMTLREYQMEAARYAIELSLREDRICTAGVWRDRLVRLGGTDLPEIDPKQRAQGEFDRKIFYYDPRTILDMIYQGQIDRIAAVFPAGSELDRELGHLVIGRDQPQGMIVFRNWLDEHMPDLQPLQLKTAGSDGQMLFNQHEFSAATRTDNFFVIHVSGGRDSFDQICWQPFMVVPLRPRSFDSNELFGLFAQNGRSLFPLSHAYSGD